MVERRRYRGHQEALSASEYRRLILCEWAEGDDALTSPSKMSRQQSEAAQRRCQGGQESEDAAALDVGTRRDLTALVVGHAEQRPEGRVVVIDRVLSWTWSATTAVASIWHGWKRRHCASAGEYGGCVLELNRMGRRNSSLATSPAKASAPKSTCSHRRARTDSHGACGAVCATAGPSLPDDDELRREFLAVRLVETGPGTVIVQNPPGTHDDIVVAVGMVVADLTERPEHPPRHRSPCPAAPPPSAARSRPSH